MEKVEIRRLAFGSYLKLALQFAVVTIFIQYAFGLVMGILRQELIINLGTFYFRGMRAFMILMIAQPMFTLILTMLVALISYVPYMIFTKLFSRTTLHYVPVTVGPSATHLSNSSTFSASAPSFAHEELRTTEPRKSGKKDDGFLSADDPRYIDMKSKRQ